MALVIASNLRKELAGDVLFDGVSFKVERRDRVALSGPNGAGKTTLLRLLNGETELHGGTISMPKGTRIALHDQRPPAESAATGSRCPARTAPARRRCSAPSSARPSSRAASSSSTRAFASPSTTSGRRSSAI